MPHLGDREGKSGRLGWEDDDLCFMEIKLAWKILFVWSHVDSSLALPGSHKVNSLVLQGNMERQ
jgi:hypothetical protein